jgi:hypothetical protein
MRSEIARDVGMTNVMSSPPLFFGIHSRTAEQRSHTGHLQCYLAQ